MAETNTSIRGLAGIQMKATPIASARWETISAAELEADPNLREANTGSHSFLSAKGDFPETFLFETREGGRGILQVLGFSEEPRGVRIRYKMVGDAAGSGRGDQAASAVPEPVAPETKEVSWSEELEVSITQYGPDHLSFRGPAEEFTDACRTVLQELGYKEVLGENSVRYPYYREGGSSDSPDGDGVAERVFLETKDGDGAVYRVRFVYLQGKDPVVMLENTSADRHRLIRALHKEFARRDFRVVWTGEDSKAPATSKKSPSLLVEFEEDAPPLVTYEVRPSRGSDSFVFNPVRAPAGIPFTADLRDAPDGDYRLWVRAPGYATQWYGITVENGIYRFSSPASGGEEDTSAIRLWKLRYLVLSYYVIHADEPDFDRAEVEFYRVAVSQGGTLPVLQGDFIVWQGEEAGGYGPEPFLRRHRWPASRGGPWGSVAIGRGDQFETTRRFAKEISSRLRNAAIPGTADRVYLVKIHGNNSGEDCYVKLWVEGIYDEPPEGVKVYRDPKQPL